MLFLKGIILGLIVAAPVGPVGVLCIKRSLKYGFVAGATGGFGSAVADSLFAAVAAFGITLIGDFLTEKQNLIKLVGGIFIIFLAAKIYFSKNEKVSKLKSENILKTFISTFFITVTNPGTIIAFTAIFATFGVLDKKTDFFDASILVLGVFLGSMLWWAILSFFVSKIKSKKEVNLLWVNRLAAFLLFIFGAWAAGTAFLSVM